MAGADTTFAAQPVVTVEGQELPDWAVPLLEQTIVDTHVHLPDIVSLRFRDEQREVLTRLGLKIGSKITVGSPAVGTDARKPLIVAEVTAFEHEHSQNGSLAIVHGFDLSHRMSRGKNTRSWHDATDSSIAKELAQAAGLEIGEVEATTIVHPHVSQVNLTDWEFIKGRAQETGYEVAVVLGKFCWRRPAASTEAPPVGDLSTNDQSLQLIVGKNLLRFRPKVSASGQVPEVEVRGWDPVTKKTLSAKVATATPGATVALDHSTVANAFGAKSHLAHDLALHTQAEVDAAAKALSEAVGSGHVEADGVALGDPRLIAGAAVSVGLAGWPYDGTYSLTSARHVYDRNGYRTTFSISGRSERSLLGLTSMGATKGTSKGGGDPIFGVIIGVVTDIKDPESRGRVKVMFPSFADDYASYWAPVSQMGAGDGRGCTFLPEVDDSVLVAFEHGDARAPYVIGQLYNGADKPAEGGGVDHGAGHVAHRGLHSRKGHALIFREDSGVFLQTAGQSVCIQLASGGDLQVDAGGNITINGGNNASITIGSDATLTIGGALSLTVGSDMTLDVGGSLAITAGASIGMTAGADITMAGQPIKLN